jgi:PAS domain S-box-containing protein
MLFMYSSLRFLRPALLVQEGPDVGRQPELRHPTGEAAAHGPNRPLAVAQLFPTQEPGGSRALGRLLGRACRWLVEPAKAIQDPGLRRHVRLLSSLLIVLVLGGIVLGIVPYLAFYGKLDRFFYLSVATVEALVFLYLLSRSRHYTAAATLTVISTSVGAFCAAALGKGSPESDLLVFLVIPVILSSILLSTGATITLLVVQVIGMAGFQEYARMPLHESWIGFVVIVSVLAMLATHHWTMVERVRSVAFATERNLLRAVIDHVPDYVVVKDVEGRYVLQNIAVLHALGAHLHEELIGKTDFEFYSSELATRYRADDQSVIRSGITQVNHEEPLVDSEGRQHWLLTTRVPLCDSCGRIIGLVEIGRDITERKQAEDALARYNRRLDILHTLDQSALAGTEADEIGRKAVQDLAALFPCSYASIVLFDPQESTGRILADWCQDVPLPGETLPFARVTCSTARREPVPLLVRDTAASSDPTPSRGTLLAAGIRTYLSIPLVAEDLVIGELNLGAAAPDAFSDEHLESAGEMADQLAMALHHSYLRYQLQQYTIDLEERVEQRTAELKRARDRVEAILNNSSDAIVLTYADGTVTRTNPMFDRLFGYKPNAMFRQPLASIVHPDYTALLNENLAAAAQDGEIRQIEIVACRADGTTFFSEVGLSLVKGEEGHHSSIVCNLRDVTARKRTEEGLRHALEKEKEVSELRSRLVATASHEFRTPLTTISSSVGLLRDYLDRMSPEQKTSHYEKIDAAVHHMTQLLDDVLLFGKAEAGRLQVDPVALDLAKLCQDALEAVQIGSDPRLEFAFTCTGQVEAVLMDEKLINRVLTSLLSNAVKFSPRGGRVQLELHGEDEQVVIRVIDQGIGIPKKDQERLGEPFYRAHNVETIKGTGLGLAIVRRAVTLQGGKLDIESEPGAGTVVTVTLPSRVAAKYE